jgi:hypothetical protein
VLRVVITDVLGIADLVNIADIMVEIGRRV